MKRYIIFLIITAYYVQSANRFVIISMPTSGTHQLIKCIELLYYPHDYWQDRVYISPHAVYTDDIYKRFIKDGYKILLNIRDPRDRLISYTYAYHSVRKIKISEDSIKKVSLELITQYGSINYAYFHHYPKSFYEKIINFGDHYYYYIPWLDYPELLVVKFEDLVGPRAGGSLKRQYETIRKIAKFIGIEATERKIKYVSDHLWGGTQSFRGPTIGLWKQYWSAAHEQKFNEIGMSKIGDILGYTF